MSQWLPELIEWNSVPKNAEYTANLVRSAISEAAKMRESDDDMM